MTLFRDLTPVVSSFHGLMLHTLLEEFIVRDWIEYTLFKECVEKNQ